MGRAMRVLRYRITTLGCRVNHAEARELESLLVERGLVAARVGERADLEVVHTCAVTETAAAKSRQAIRRSRRRQHLGGSFANFPEAQRHSPDSAGDANLPEILVTGCLGSTNPEEAVQLAGGPDRVIAHQADGGLTLTDRFAQRLDRCLAAHRVQGSLRTRWPGSCREKIVPLPVVMPRAASAHVRAELKIQDGCDAACTFCVIPKIRRTLRSKRIADAVDEARRLVELGHCEIVLTGIFIGAYGHETALRRRQARPGPQPLADLVDAVARVGGLQRLRISSLEPGDVCEVLLDAMVANSPVVAPHLHLPLQSGSDAILRRMNRQYRLGDYLQMIQMVKQRLTTPDGLPPAITTDVLCGFPGETEEDFRATVGVARQVGFLHMHVFGYSPRRLTAAARWKQLFVAPAIIKARVRRLIDLESDPVDGLALRYRRRLLGRSVRVIIEQPDKNDASIMRGRCDHYAEVWLPTNRRRGTLVQAQITRVTPARTVGRVLSPIVSLPVLA